MKNKLKIVTDGASDLSEEYLNTHDITNIPFYITDNSNDQPYLMDVDELYEEMLKNPNKMFKTACPSPDAYYNVFKENVDKGFAVLCVCISKELSGSFNSATIAKNMILEEKPDAQVAIIDSIQNSASQGLVVRNLQTLKEKDLDFKKALEKIEENKKTGRIVFFVDNLKYLENGGRIGKLKSLVSSLLNIKPLIIMENGNIHSGGMGLGIKKSMAKVMDTVKNFIAQFGKTFANYNFTIGYGATKEIGENLKTAFEKQYSLNSADINFDQIGSTSAVHTGPHTYGIGMIEKV